MADIQIVKTDQGAVNARILAREAKADFRRVEAASLKLRTHFTSAEAKRIFVRMFNTLQLNAHFVSVIARTRIDHKDIEAAEVELRTDIDAVKNKLNQALDGAEVLFKAHGISGVATYDTQPLEIEVGVLSSSARRYLEVLNQFDQLMPLLQTLEIHEVITTQALDIQRAALKREIKNIATLARRQATGLRRRMNALGARDDDDAAGVASAGTGLRSGRETRALAGPELRQPGNHAGHDDGGSVDASAAVTNGQDQAPPAEMAVVATMPMEASVGVGAEDPTGPLAESVPGGPDAGQLDVSDDASGVQVRRVRRRVAVIAPDAATQAAAPAQEVSGVARQEPEADAGPAAASQ